METWCNKAETCKYIYTSLSLLCADTTRSPHPDEDPNSFYFVREDNMRAEIMRHKFIEFGKHQQHLYGIKSDSVVDVIQSGKMCIMDVHPQVRDWCIYVAVYGGTVVKREIVQVSSALYAIHASADVSWGCCYEDTMKVFLYRPYVVLWPSLLPTQALKLLRTSQFRPLVIFVKAASPDGVRKLHTSARVDNKQGHSLLTVSWGGGRGGISTLILL